jgi:HEAT repeat protein
MGLSELCLSTLLSLPQPAPQTPMAAPVPAPVVPASTPAPTPSTQDPAATDAARLALAERTGKPVPIDALTQFLGAADAAVAARAAWLLGRHQDAAALPMLATAATTSAHTSVRLQAMAALLRHGSQRSLDAAIRGLDDADVQVRTIAAQLLGRLRSEAGRAPLLALLDRRAKADAGQGPTTDLQAAILALHDMEATAQLLPAATALNDSKVAGCGQALTFYFQSLSPRLPTSDEATLLLSVLDHREAMLRRYAISRLGELRVATTATALEQRLGVEGPELRPLLEVAIHQVRDQQHGAPTDASMPDGLLASLRQRWQSMPETQQLATAGFGGLLLVAAAALAIVWRRRRAALLDESAPAAVDLVAPSEEYLQAEVEAAEAAATDAIAADADADVIDVETVPGAFSTDGSSDAADTGLEVAEDDSWQPVGPADDASNDEPQRG